MVFGDPKARLQKRGGKGPRQAQTTFRPLIHHGVGKLLAWMIHELRCENAGKPVATKRAQALEACTARSSARHRAARRLGTRFALEVGFEEMRSIGVIQAGIRRGSGVRFGGIPSQTRKVFNAPPPNTAFFGPVTEDDVASAEHTGIAVGVVQGVGIA